MGYIYIYLLHVYVYLFLYRERERETIDIYIYCLRRTPNKHISRRMCFAFLSSDWARNVVWKTSKNRMKKSRRHCKTNMAYYDSFVCPGVHPTSYYIFSQLFLEPKPKTWIPFFPSSKWLPNLPTTSDGGPPPLTKLTTSIRWFLEARRPCCQTTCHCLQEFQHGWPWWLGQMMILSWWWDEAVGWSVGCRFSWVFLAFSKIKINVYPLQNVWGNDSHFWRSYFSKGLKASTSTFRRFF